MQEIRFYIVRFIKRLPWFLIVAVALSAIGVTVAMTLPPAYESNVKLIVESQQIPDELARSTVAAPAAEQLQILEQRLLTRENLLGIANDVYAVRGQEDMSPDEIVQAMRAQTTVRRSSRRDAANLMTITFEAPTAQAAAAVLNAYLTLILEQDAEFRTGRAVTTLEFFQQQVDQLGGDLNHKSTDILKFKNEHADALPETLQFRMSEQSRLQERVSRLESEITNLQNQRAQLIRLAEATKRLGEDPNKATVQLSPRQRRLTQLRQELAEARVVYSEESARVRQLRALIAQLEADESEQAAGADDGAAPDQEPQDPNQLMLDVQLADIDARIDALEAQKTDLETQLETLRDTIARTPANVIALEALNRDYENIQGQYNQAVARLSAASTGERIEFMSRGQRITVIEPPAVPDKPTKPDRKKLAVAGVGAGVLGGLGLVFLLELLSRTPHRPEDIVARFEVMPIATIPYVRTRRQMVLERAVKLLVILCILIGIPAAIWAVHTYYMPLDLVADKVMNRLGVRW